MRFWSPAAALLVLVAVFGTTAQLLDDAGFAGLALVLRESAGAGAIVVVIVVGSASYLLIRKLTRARQDRHE